MIKYTTQEQRQAAIKAAQARYAAKKPKLERKKQDVSGENNPNYRHGKYVVTK